MVAQHRGHRGRRRRDVVRLGRDHDEIAEADLGRVRGRPDAHRALAARALDAQAACLDGVDVLGPGIDRPDLVARIGEQRRVDRAHGAGADDRDFHA